MKNYLHVVELPFKGYIETTINALTGEVHYTGERVEERSTQPDGATLINIYYKNALTFEQYQNTPENAGKNLKALTGAEMDVLFEAWEESQQTEFKEITEEKYWYFLEVLPPQRFTKITRGNFFFMSEANFGNNHGCVAQLGKKYFFADRSIFESTESLIKAINKAAK